ncbi:dentin sialophosphoprotein-like [Aplysia californica]|uniref:Dentin sialophosphoprotein-like n=1 Tax=Aplysia californica TaxID=6500 RepID=A0ABM1VXJ1_APLCA|nr:dentin sialophosphoprotein-like [Aplysia californica]
MFAIEGASPSKSSGLGYPSPLGGSKGSLFTLPNTSGAFSRGPKSSPATGNNSPGLLKPDLAFSSAGGDSGAPSGIGATSPSSLVPLSVKSSSSPNKKSLSVAGPVISSPSSSVTSPSELASASSGMPFLPGSSLLSRGLTSSAGASGPPKGSDRGDQSLSDIFFRNQAGNPAAAVLPSGGFKKEFDASLLGDMGGSYANSMVVGDDYSDTYDNQNSDSFSNSKYTRSDSDSDQSNRFSDSDSGYMDSKYDTTDSTSNPSDYYYDGDDDDEKEGENSNYDYYDYPVSEEDYPKQNYDYPSRSTDDYDDNVVASSRSPNDDRNDYRYSDYDRESNDDFTLDRNNKNKFSNSEGRSNDGSNSGGREAAIEKNENIPYNSNSKVSPSSSSSSYTPYSPNEPADGYTTDDYSSEGRGNDYYYYDDDTPDSSDGDRLSREGSDYDDSSPYLYYEDDSVDPDENDSYRYSPSDDDSSSSRFEPTEYDYPESYDAPPPRDTYSSDSDGSYHPGENAPDGYIENLDYGPSNDEFLEKRPPPKNSYLYDSPAEADSGDRYREEPEIATMYSDSTGDEIFSSRNDGDGGETDFDRSYGETSSPDVSDQFRSSAGSDNPTSDNSQFLPTGPSSGASTPGYGAPEISKTSLFIVPDDDELIILPPPASNNKPTPQRTSTGPQPFNRPKQQMSSGGFACHLDDPDSFKTDTELQQRLDADNIGILLGIHALRTGPFMREQHD